MSERIFRNRWIELCHYSKDSIGVIFTTGCEDWPGNRLKLYGFGYWLAIRIPNLVQPYREKVKATYWDAATIERMGRDWYWNVHAREFGVAVNCGNHFNIYYGKQSHDSSKENRWSCFPPWTEWQHVRTSGYGEHGEWLFDEPRGPFLDTYDARKALQDSQYKAKFDFSDYDGEVITATCRIEEREWHKGVRAFRWLRYLVKPMIRRSLDIAFSAEVGRRKGSWKGGTLGHGIDMQPGELHEAAFRRYCAEQNLSFIGSTPPGATNE